MQLDQKILNKIVNWCTEIPAIKSIILEGSIACGQAKDEYSDFDINLFTEDVTAFLEDDKWFEQFGDIVVFQKEGTFYRGTFIPTRLVIYQNSPRVDFSLWPVAILEDWIKDQELPEFYKNGYQILLDKTGIAENLPQPDLNGYLQTKPSNKKFRQVVYNFYFEAAIIAKYLYRKNLWFACKLSSGPIKDFLQQMIMWQTAEKERWELKGLNSLGKNLEEKISESITTKLSSTFSSYDLDECWKSLFAMIDLFDQISIPLSSKLNFDFPNQKIQRIKNYITDIQRKK